MHRFASPTADRVFRSLQGAVNSGQIKAAVGVALSLLLSVTVAVVVSSDFGAGATAVFAGVNFSVAVLGLLARRLKKVSHSDD